jgi:hypothetical protein
MRQWIKESEHCMSHPSGWTIAKYNVNGVPVYMLWQGDASQGKFDSARDAMRRHSELVPTAPDTETPDN